MFKEMKIAEQIKMLDLLRENKDKINAMIAEQKLTSFVLFGDNISETTSGIANINIIIINDDKPGYMTLVNLQKSLTEILNLSVNIYTKDSLRDQFSEFHIEKLTKAKTLDQILSTAATFTPSAPTPQ